MRAVEKIPAYILEIARQSGINTGDIIISLYCDMDSEHLPCHRYIFADSKKIYVLSGTDSLEKKKNGKGLVGAFSVKEFFSVDLESLETVEVEELLSSARLVAKTKDGEFVFISAMTNFCKSEANFFVKYLRRIRKGDITTSDFELDREDDPKETCCPKCGMRYPDKNRKICPRCMEKGKLYSRFAVFFKKYKKELVILFLSLLMLTGTAILVPYFSKGFFFDKVLDKNGSLYGQVLVAVGIVAATQFLSQLADMVNGYISTIISAKIVYDLKNTIFGAIEKLSMSFFGSRQTGSLMTQVGEDANTIYGFFCDGIPYFLINIVQVVILTVILFVMNPLLAALSLATVPIFFVLLRLTYHHSKKLHARKYSGSKGLGARLSDVLTGIRVVKAFSKEKDELDRFEYTNKSAAEGSKKLAVFNNYSYPAIAYVLYIGNVISLGVGGYMVMKGSFTYGELMTFTAYINMIYSPIHFFSQMINWSASCTNALSRLFEIYDTEPDITEKKDAITPDKIEGRVTFSNVSFGYNKTKKIIDNVSFDVEAGKTLGIVGHTGAGKSTLANLLMRLYDCDEGSILIDGINVKDLSFSAIYENIAIVSQETYLFMGTILENIKYAKPEATHEQVIKAAKCAGAHDFIMRLPDGYETRIGFGNKELSGGERQRLSIARAILRDPKILILDEATAAMDTKTEKLIQNALYDLTRDKTTIMIAHRLSTLRDAHSLIVIEKGKAVERGTHAELLAIEDGVYNRLYTLQAEALKNAGITE